jgi:hypothetical protein
MLGGADGSKGSTEVIELPDTQGSGETTVLRVLDLPGFLQQIDKLA